MNDINTNAYSMAVAAEIAKERCDQTAKHGWSRGHDDDHLEGEIAMAAAAYAIATVNKRKAAAILPLDWQPRFKDDARRNLVIAGALIIAEIERLDRATRASHPQPMTKDKT